MPLNIVFILTSDTIAPQIINMKDLPKYLRPEWQHLTEEQLRQDRIKFVEGSKGWIDPETALDYLYHQFDMDAFFLDRTAKNLSEESKAGVEKIHRNICYDWGLELMFADDAIRITDVRWDLWLGKDSDCELFTFLVFTEEFLEGITCLKSRQFALELIQYLYDMRKDLLGESSNHAYIVAAWEAYIVKFKKEIEYDANTKRNSKQTLSESEYILSLQEIIAYANGEGKAHAEAIRSMLRYFKDEKEGWDNAKVKKLIHDIQLPDSKTFNITQANQVVGNLEKQDIHHD